MDEGFKSARDIIEAETEDLLVVDGLDEVKIKSIREMMQRDLDEAEVEEEDEEESDDDAEDKTSEVSAEANANSPSEASEQQPTSEESPVDDSTRREKK